MSKSARLAADLGDPKWIRLLKMEATMQGSSMKDVLIAALDVYFAERLETNALAKVAETAFEEWNNPLDAEYDRL
jgi:hypothetical protein